jgi:UDP-N-acetyl-D-glucosamine/UDP-N-acetyl-D-galactosamine dehydrogenase
MTGPTDPRSRRIAVLGLGYVGLPVAAAFARQNFAVLGYDVDADRVRELNDGFDRTGEVDAADLRLPRLEVTSDPAALGGADFYIVTVPTPIDASRRPDLSALLRASETLGRHLRRGDIVVYESTVYPGATEEDCAPVLERSSGLSAGTDFFLGYSPERINPGDALHRFETVRKVVAGQDGETLRTIASVYGTVVSAGLHLAPSIRVAEAAKVIENSQRDLNIAFMNELSSIFHLLDIDTADVLAAAGTKWNFLPFTPGLVGGHCIGVDPYYLTHRAEREGYHPQVILAGRRINDAVGERVARECVRLLLAGGAPRRRVAILGVTFKENVPDIRNSRVFDIVRELERFGIDVEIADPLASPEDVRDEHGLKLSTLDRLGPADAVILAVPHRAILAGGWPMIERLLAGGRGIVLDVKGVLDRARQPDGVVLWRM